MDSYIDYEEPETGRGIRKVILAVVVLLVSGLVVVGGGLVIKKAIPVIFDSPERAAETWFTAFFEADGQVILDRTCNEQIEVSNWANLVIAAPEVAKEIKLLEILQMADIAVPQDLDVVSNLLRDLKFDLSKLEYSGHDNGDGTAVVIVEGQIRLRFIGNAWFGLPVSETWNMVEEGGQWKWCGRQ